MVLGYLNINVKKNRPLLCSIYENMFLIYFRSKILGKKNLEWKKGEYLYYFAAGKNFFVNIKSTKDKGKNSNVRFHLN